MADSDEQRPDLHDFTMVFGEQPPTKTVLVKGNEEVPGIPVVFRELLEWERLAISVEVGRHDAYEVKDVARAEQTLARSIVSTDGREWPEKLEDRLYIVRHWRESAVTVLANSWADFWEEIKGTVLVVANSPNRPGASDGPSSRARDVGQGGRSD